MKRFALLFAVLALVAAACSSGSSDDTTTTTAAATEGDSEAAQETTAAGATLKEVQDRGTLKCGVSGTSVGMSETDASGNTLE